MKKFLNILLSVSTVACALVGCDKVSINETVEHEPIISEFTPSAAPVGAEITIKGEYLNDVTQALIGSVPVTIRSKVSNTLMSITVGQDVTSGQIVLINSTGKGTSEGTFTCSFAVPTIAESLLQSEAEMGSTILLTGEHLNSVRSVRFVAEGYEQGHTASVISSSDEELVVKVPYVESDEARIVLVYSDGQGDVSTDIASAPRIKVIRYVPKFDEFTLARTAVGRSITLTGQYLNNIDKVTVGDFDAPIFKEPSKLTFTIPAGDFQDGETQVVLKAWYFDQNESVTLADPFTVYVPFVRYWENIKLYCQGRFEGNSYASFFSPETGTIYENAKWASVLDPVAMKYANSQWGSANMPKPGVVSDEDYSSVVPYFFFSSVSGNVLQINSPANSNSQLKNFYINAVNPEGTGSNDNRVPGGNTSMPGTPIIGFRYLNPASTSPAEQALIAAVKSDSIDRIDEATFPIDVAAGTIAGVSVTSMSGGIKSSVWCDHQTSTLVEQSGYDPDAIFLVAYYSNNGYSKETPAANILRLGLMRITNINWAIYNASTYANSDVTFNIWWQKYDYDYSKL